MHYRGKQADEFFAGNHEGPLDDDLLPLADGIRLGDVALDIDGKVIPEKCGYRPVFVKNSCGERYHQIREERLSAIRGHRYAASPPAKAGQEREE